MLSSASWCITLADNTINDFLWDIVADWVWIFLLFCILDTPRLTAWIFSHTLWLHLYWTPTWASVPSCCYHA